MQLQNKCVSGVDYSRLCCIHAMNSVRCSSHQLTPPEFGGGGGGGNADPFPLAFWVTAWLFGLAQATKPMGPWTPRWLPLPW